MTFIHSGDAGDVLYSLPAARTLAKKRGHEKFTFVLGRKQGTLHPFTDESGESVASLLRVQPYIEDCYIQKDGQRWDVDFDPYRNYLINNFKRWKNLCQYHAELIQVPNESDHPWLTVDHKAEVPGRPVVINRTPRYRNPMFSWKRIYERYKNVAVFIGRLDEYDNFQEECGPIPYAETPQLIDAARLIAGAKLFVGNQSVCRAIAEGLKQNTILESSRKIGNTVWRRPNLWVGIDGRVPMPHTDHL
jgi:hypothetical protein